MISETKTTTCTNSTSCPLVNPFSHMDKKAFKQYKLESRKILIRSFIITFVIGVIYALISPPDGIIDPFFIAPLSIIFIIVLVVTQTKLRAKYKIPNVYRNFPNHTYYEHKPFYRRSNTNEFDPGVLGSRAWAADKFIKRMHEQKCFYSFPSILSLISFFISSRRAVSRDSPEFLSCFFSAITALIFCSLANPL